MGDMPCVGVVGLLEKGEVLSGLCGCFVFFLALWCQFFNADATRSLKMVGLMLVPIWIKSAYKVNGYSILYWNYFEFQIYTRKQFIA